MRIEDAVQQLAEERFTNPTKDDILFVAGVMTDVARQQYSYEPTRSNRLDLERAEAYYDSLRSIQAGVEGGPQG